MTVINFFQNKVQNCEVKVILIQVQISVKTGLLQKTQKVPKTITSPVVNVNVTHCRLHSLEDGYI